MDHSTVKIIDLWAVSNLMKSDNMKYVTVRITDDGSLDFTAAKSIDGFESVSYDSVEPIAENPEI